MIKVFSILRGTNIEYEINMLIEKGVSYISKFEEVLGIVGTYNDVEILYNNGLGKTELFLIINGSIEERFFVDKGAEVTTIEQLKKIIVNDNLSSQKTVQRISYKVELLLTGRKVWRINSRGKQIA